MGHQGFESRARTRRRNRFKHKKMGLCIYCSQNAVKGSCYCKKHREINMEKCRKYRKFKSSIIGSEERK